MEDTTIDSKQMSFHWFIMDVILNNEYLHVQFFLLSCVNCGIILLWVYNVYLILESFSGVLSIFWTEFFYFFFYLFKANKLAVDTTQ